MVYLFIASVCVGVCLGWTLCWVFYVADRLVSRRKQK